MVDEARRTTELTAGVVETMAVNEDRLRQTLDAGFTQATDLADELMVRCGLDYAAPTVSPAGPCGSWRARAAARELTPDLLGAAAVEVLGAPLAHDPGDLGRARPGRHRGHPHDRRRHCAAAVDEMADEIESRRKRCSPRPRPTWPLRRRRDGAAGARRSPGAASDEGERGGDRHRTRRDPDVARGRGGGERRPAHVRRRRGRAGPSGRLRRLADPCGRRAGAGRRAGPAVRAAIADRGAANAEVVRRLDEGVPQLVDVAPAGTVVPGSTGGRSSCGPPLDYADACDPLRRSMRAAVVAEGWATTREDADRMLGDGQIRLDAATPTTSSSPWSPRWDRRNRCGWPSSTAVRPRSPPSTRGRARPRGSVGRPMPPSIGCASWPMPRARAGRGVAHPRPDRRARPGRAGRPDGRRRAHPGPGHDQPPAAQPAAPPRRLRPSGSCRGGAVPVVQPPVLPDRGHGRARASPAGRPR